MQSTDPEQCPSFYIFDFKNHSSFDSFHPTVTDRVWFQHPLVVFFSLPRFIIAPPRCIKAADLLEVCFHKYRGTVGHFLGKRKEAIAPPTTTTPLTGEGLYGTHFLTLTPHYSTITIWPGAFVIPVLPKTENTNLTYFINK